MLLGLEKSRIFIDSLFELPALANMKQTQLSSTRYSLFAGFESDLTRISVFPIAKYLIQCIFFIFLMLVLLKPTLAQNDSSKSLKRVIISAEKRQNTFHSTVPVQQLNYESLQEINAESIADAAKYFSGVFVKDYGGVGGLKTISARSLGAFNTSLEYDGIIVADAQTGQIDLSKFSSTFVQSLELSDANPQQILSPARSYSSASILSISTNAFNATNFTQNKWQAGIKQGSFGLWQPYGGIYFPLSNAVAVSADAEALWNKGNYPYRVNNGMFSENLSRSNSDIQAFQGEANIVKQFPDSAQWQTKFWGYSSQRGLPGSIVFFNNTSAQRLWEEDLFAQSRYQKKITPYTSLLVSVKYSSLFTRYKDPDFLNNAGGLDNRYYQHEVYLSTALSHHFGKYFSTSVASDFASSNLTSNISSFASPTRFSWWNNVALQYADIHWKIHASLLNSTFHYETKTGAAASDKDQLTPSFSASYQSNESPWLFRVFYKNIFRLPTFNDLYYNYTSSINAKLLPEFSKQYNVGATYSKDLNSVLKQLNISVDAYYNSIKDKIITVPAQNLFMWTVLNLGKVHIKGIDLTTQLNGKLNSAIRCSVRIAYTWQQALDVTNPSSSEYKNEIPYTPDNSGSALITFYYKSWSAGYSFLLSGTRYTLGENDPSNELVGWVIHDIFVTRSIKLKYFQIHIKAETDNIFNEKYEVIRYYPMPGRSYKINISFTNL
ncbi:MAG TPA: TonB-dependent receptor plug domain-containing protein [Puia sp.]|nr:TonB-dependent receptor plug domain-containing protein [Puia sp.]